MAGKVTASKADPAQLVLYGMQATSGLHFPYDIETKTRENVAEWSVSVRKVCPEHGCVHLCLEYPWLCLL